MQAFRAVSFASSTAMLVSAAGFSNFPIRVFGTSTKNFLVFPADWFVSTSNGERVTITYSCSCISRWLGRVGAGKSRDGLFLARPAQFVYEKTGLTDAIRSPLIHNFSRLLQS